MNSGRRPFTALAHPSGIGWKPLLHPRFVPLNIARRHAGGDRVQILASASGHPEVVEVCGCPQHSDLSCFDSF
jgi:hypothetical protein